MDKKKRRSSILKKICEEEITAVSSTSKLKRRISFSGKKSVRVFRGDDETKTYDNSYEESDHAGNLSGEVENIGHNIVNVHQKRIPLRSRVVVVPENKNVSSSNHKQQSKIVAITNISEEVDKENRMPVCSSVEIAQAQPNSILEAAALVTVIEKTKSIFATSWNKTMDFINNTQNGDTPLHVENSVDVTLNDQELRHGVVASKKKCDRPSHLTDDPRPSISFSMEEDEPKLLHHGKQSAQRNLHPLFNFSHQENKSSQVLQNNKKNTNSNEHADVENSMLQPSETEFQREHFSQTHVIAKNQMSILGNKTNAASMSIDFSDNDYEEVEKIGKCSRKTIHDAENMKESFSMNGLPNRKTETLSIHMDESIKSNFATSNFLRRKAVKNDRDNIYEIQNKENNPEILRRKTITNDRTMDMSGIYHIQNNESIHNDLRRKTVNRVQNMELSAIEPIQSEENIPLQLNARNTTNHANSSDEINLSKLDMSYEIQEEILDVVENAASNFNDKLNRITLRTTQDDIKRNEEHFEEFFKSTIIPQPKQLQWEDKNSCEMDISMDMQDIEKSSSNDLSKKLDQNLQTSATSPVRTLEVDAKNKRQTIVFNNEEAFELDVSKCNTLHKTGPVELNTINNIKDNFVHNGDRMVEKFYEEIEPEPNKHLRELDKKGAIPKVVVVHKTCVTKTNQETTADLQFQRFQRYQNKQKENILSEAKEKLCTDTIENHTKRGSSSAEQSFMSPESQSIFPPHYQQYGSRSKFNLRQLNEEIESGKLQLFPDTKKKLNNKPPVSKITTETPHENNLFRSKILCEAQMEMEQSPFTIYTQSNNKQSVAKRQTLLIPEDMEVEHEAENKYQTTTKIYSIIPFNSAKHLLHKKCLVGSVNFHSQEDSLDIELKEDREETICGGNNNLNQSQLLPDIKKMHNNKPQSSEIIMETPHENNSLRSKFQFEDQMEIQQSPFTIFTQSKRKQSVTKRQTLLIPSDMEVEQPQVEQLQVEQPLEEHEAENIYRTTKTELIIPSNLAKHLLHKKCIVGGGNSYQHEDSFQTKLKEARKLIIYGGNNNLNQSPLRNTVDQEEHMRRLYEGTPHRSVLEFEFEETKNECNTNINLNNNIGTPRPIDMEINETLSNQVEAKQDFQKGKLFYARHNAHSQNTFECPKSFAKINKECLKSILHSKIETEYQSYNAKERQAQFLKDCELEESLKETNMEENDIQKEIKARQQLTNYQIANSPAMKVTANRETLCQPMEIELDETCINLIKNKNIPTEMENVIEQKIIHSFKNADSDLNCNVQTDNNYPYEKNTAFKTKNQNSHKNVVLRNPDVKKRYTQIFNDCDLDESCTNKNLLTNKNKTIDYVQPTNQKTLKSTTTRNTICEPLSIEQLEENNVCMTQNIESAEHMKKVITDDISSNDKSSNLPLALIESKNQKMSINVKRQTQFYNDCDIDESFIPAVKEDVYGIKYCQEITNYDITKFSNDILTKRRDTISEPLKIDFDETNNNQLKASKESYKIMENKKNRESTKLDVTTESDSEECSKHSTLKTALAKSLMVKVDSQKRTTINFTPNLPEAKKRQKFDINDREKQLTQKSGIINQTKNTNLNELFTKRTTLLYPEDIEAESVISARRKNILLPQAMEVQDNSFVFDEACKAYDHNTNMELSRECSISHSQINKIPDIQINSVHKSQSVQDVKASRIPILIESAKKNKSNLSRLQSPRNASVSQINQTIQTPRRTISKHVDQSIYVEQFIGCDEKSQCIQPTFEDNPITISDVSVHYLAQKQKQNNTIKDDAREDTQTKAKILRKLVDMTFESPIFCSDSDDIDDTRISLVGTLLDEDDDDDNDCEVNKTIETLLIADNTNQNITKPINDMQSVCHKCKRCQNTINNEDTLNTTDSFVLPEMPPLPDLGIERLNRLRAKPTIDETIEYWRRVHVAADTYQSSDDDEEDETEEEDEVDVMIKQFEEKLKRNEKALQEELHLLKKNEARKLFHERLDMRVRKHLPNWIFNYQMLIRNFYQFDHKKIMTFSLITMFEPKDPLRRDVTIKCIKQQPSRVPSTRWKAIDFILDFQLKLELPFNLNQLYRNKSNDDDAIYEALEEVDKVCVRVQELGMLFWKTICQERAVLIRGPHATYVRKIVRKLISPNANIKYSRIQCTEFKIEVTNIRKICFKDIVSPPLHFFREDLEYLPVGIEFLSVFLSDPVSYLKD